MTELSSDKFAIQMSERFSDALAIRSFCIMKTRFTGNVSRKKK